MAEQIFEIQDIDVEFTNFTRKLAQNKKAFQKITSCSMSEISSVCQLRQDLITKAIGIVVAILLIILFLM